MILILLTILTRRYIMERIEDIEKRIVEKQGRYLCSDGTPFQNKIFAILHERKLVRLENRKNNGHNGTI